MCKAPPKEALAWQQLDNVLCTIPLSEILERLAAHASEMHIWNTSRVLGILAHHDERGEDDPIDTLRLAQAIMRALDKNYR